MSGAWERFITSIRNFLAGSPEKVETREAPLHRMPEPEEEVPFYLRAEYEEEEEKEEPSDVTLAEGAGFVVKREAEA